jgi:CRISPR-associated endoribonuclease Cas6
MPAAALLFLQAREPGAIRGFSGQHAHGFWLNHWHDINPEIGDSLHDGRSLRQYTVGPFTGLADTVRGRTAVADGDIAILRLTSLDDTQQPHLLEEWLAQVPDQPRIGSVLWQPQRVIRDRIDHSAAGETTYLDLQDRYRNDRPVPKQWTLSFESPMAVHLLGDRYLPFPLPEKIVRSWLDYWIEYAALPLLTQEDTREAFLARVAAGLLVSRYKLKTVAFRFKFGRAEVPQIGCVGQVTISGDLTAADRAVVATLVDFAFYCGTGHHTTMGMGQTRVVDKA